MLAFSLVAGAAAQQPCVPRDVVALNNSARDRLFEVNLGDAMQLAERAIASLACHEGHLSPHQIASIYQSGAVIALQFGNRSLAEAWMSSAVRVVPGVGYDVYLGEEGAQLYAEMQQAVGGAATVTVFARHGVLLDGWYLAPGDTRQVPAGGHLLQWREEATIVTESVFVEGTEPQAVGPAAAPPPSPSSPPPEPPAVFVLGGGLAVAGGAFLLALPAAQNWTRTGWYEPHAGQQQQAATYRSRAMAYTVGGISLISIGTTSMVWSFSVSSSQTVSLQGTW